MSRTPSSIVARAAARAFALAGACNTTRAVRTAAPAAPRGPAPTLAPSAERIAALADLPSVWVERSRIARMYDGATAYVRNRTMRASGPNTPLNAHPVRVVLGNRSSSHGPDRDRDGLSDAAESMLGTNPDNFDTDGDTLPDGFALFATGTSPLRTDADDDGMADNVELNVDDPAIYADTDGDGFTDGQERAAFNTNPNSLNSDGDGFGDDLEYFFGTAMNDAAHPTVDSDGDGEPDDFEVANNTSPTDRRSVAADTDNDDVPDWLDPDAVMMARAHLRRSAVAAGPADCGISTSTRASRDPFRRRRLAPVLFAKACCARMTLALRSLLALVLGGLALGHGARSPWLLGERAWDWLTHLPLDAWLLTQAPVAPVRHVLSWLGYFPTALLALGVGAAVGSAFALERADRPPRLLAAALLVLVASLVPPRRSGVEALRGVRALRLDRRVETLPFDPWARVVVWPETVGRRPLALPSEGPVHDQRIPAPMRGPARAMHLLGYYNRPAERVENSAVLARSDGELLWHRAKSVLFPAMKAPWRGLWLGAQAFTPGTLEPVAPLEGGRVGVLVCLELLDRSMVARATPPGVELLLVPAGDSVVGLSEVGREVIVAVASLAAAERGVAIARSSWRGVAALVAPDGSVVARSDEGHLRDVAGPPLRSPWSR